MRGSEPDGELTNRERKKRERPPKKPKPEKVAKKLLYAEDYVSVDAKINGLKRVDTLAHKRSHFAHVTHEMYDGQDNADIVLAVLDLQHLMAWNTDQNRENGGMVPKPPETMAIYKGLFNTELSSMVAELRHMLRSRGVDTEKIPTKYNPPEDHTQPPVSPPEEEPQNAEVSKPAKRSRARRSNKPDPGPEDGR